MTKKNKKGVSTIVATVLIILLTMAAIAILVQFLVPFVRDNLTKSTECIPYSTYFKFKETFRNETGSTQFNCYQRKNGNHLSSTMIEVTSNNSANMPAGFTLVYYKGTTTKSIKITKGQAQSTGIDGIWMLGEKSSSATISIPNQGEALTYVFNSDSDFEYVEVYPLLTSGRACQRTDKIEFINCDPKTNLDQ